MFNQVGSSTSKIKVAIVGVGNCASSLVQGVEYYKNVKGTGFIPGLIHTSFGGYRISDIEFVAAFDIDARKVDTDLSSAIFSEPNCTKKFSKVSRLGVKVSKGTVLDGVGKYLKPVIKIDSAQKSADVVKILKETKADVLVNYLPVGSGDASRFYADAALKANTAFLNCIPEFIVSDKVWGKRFKSAGVPCAGDDIKSQLGATIVHRTLAKLFIDRGVKLDESYQLNIGGNTDFLNMLEQERLISKRISKTEAVASQVPYEVPLRIGPSDYVSFLKDNKVCYIYMKGKIFGDIQISLDLKLSVEDSPNSAGIVIDVIRGLKIARDRGIGGPLLDLSSYYFKHPPLQKSDTDAKQTVEDFIKGEVV